MVREGIGQNCLLWWSKMAKIVRSIIKAAGTVNESFELSYQVTNYIAKPPNPRRLFRHPR